MFFKMVLNIVLLTLGIAALIESVVALIFPNWTIKIGKALLKNMKSVKKVGVIELIVAIILILIGMNI